jgi:hypothetical protein
LKSPGLSIYITESTDNFEPEPSRMPIPSYRIAPGANRDIIPPISHGAALPQTGSAARKVASRERPDMLHRHAATPAPNHKSAFPRIHPMNPEPAVAPAPNLKSAFLRIHPMNPEPTATPAQNPNSTFLRIHPMNPEPAATPAPNHKSAFPRIHPMNPESVAAPAPNPKSTVSRINPAASQSPAACCRTCMTDPSRRTDGFTRSSYPPTDPHLRTVQQAP